MIHEREVVVGGDNADIIYIRVCHVRQNKVDKTVSASVGHRGDGAPIGELRELFVMDI